MALTPLIVLQTSALSRINFVYNDLKSNPPVIMVSAVLGKDKKESVKNYLSLDLTQQKQFSKELFLYLQRESLTESKIMLIINYIHALLIKTRTNKISIHHNFQHKQVIIDKFEKDNAEILTKIKKVRNKVYSHLDPNWLEDVKNIPFEEIEICINFLNKLFDYNFEKLLGENL